MTFKPEGLKGIRAVTYDCWGTLLRDQDWEAAMTRRATALARVVGSDRAAARDLLEEAWLRQDAAWKQTETFGAGRMAAYCLEKSGIQDDDVLAALTRGFEEASLEAGVVGVDGALDALRALERAGLRRGLICDTGFTPGRVVRQLLDRAGLLRYLEVQCFSDEVGVPKPGNGIFAAALDELGVRPRDAMHVGDLRRTDIAGARDMGMRAVRFRGVHDDTTDAPDADIVIDAHTEVVEMLGLNERE